MSLKQINATYLISEDRILFRFNTQSQGEYRLWFTRRVTLFILSATTHLVVKQLEQNHSSDAAKALNEFGNQVAAECLATNNQNTPEKYEPGINYPLGFDPLLVMDVNCSINQDNKLAYIEKSSNKEAEIALVLEFILPGGVSLKLNLNEHMVRAVCLLLDQLRRNANWGEAVITDNTKESVLTERDIEGTKNISIH